MPYGGMFGLRGLPGDYLTDPRMMMAQRLMNQGIDTSPVQHWTQGMGRLASALAGAYMMNKSMGDNEAASQAMMQGATAKPWVNPDTGQASDAQAGGYAGALASLGQMQGNPFAAKLTRDLMTKKMDYDIARQDKLEDRNTMWGREDAVYSRNRADKMEDYESQLKLARQYEKPVPGKDVPYPQDVADQAVEMAAAKKPKQLPSSALKMQGDELDAIATAGGINADLGAIAGQIERGELNLGPIKNILSAGKNIAGMSDANSRNFASFQSTLEKLRNDSLRLNKGVQTEGDAVRAWNELVKNINDPQVVRQRLAEIQEINNRAVMLRKNNIDVIRSNFGVDPLDTSAYERQAPALGGSRASGGIKFLGFE